MPRVKVARDPAMEKELRARNAKFRNRERIRQNIGAKIRKNNWAKLGAVSALLGKDPTRTKVTRHKVNAYYRGGSRRRRGGSLMTTLMPLLGALMQ